MSFHPAAALVVNEVDRATLNAVVRAPTSEQRAVTRARIVLASADGTAISRIAHELGVTVNTVKLWRRRYERMGLADLVEAARPGRPAVYRLTDLTDRQAQASQSQDVQVQHRPGA